MTRLLITGASGNIGTALLRRLAGREDVEIVGLARRPPPSEPPYDNVRWQRVDLSEDSAPAALDEAMTGVDAVVHLAWAFQPTRRPDYLTRVGVGGTAAVLAAADRAGVGHFVHMSSVGAYAAKTSDTPVEESYPHTGMTSSQYSNDKAAAERLLDTYAQDHPAGMTLTRIRPGIVMQRDAGAALDRYGLPAYFPARLLRYLPVLPLDGRFAIPVVHSDDVADALDRVLEQGRGGEFNLAADEPLTREIVADVLGARPVQVPATVLRAIVAGSWKVGLQPLSPGWIDLAFAVPLQNCAHAHHDLGWRPSKDPHQVLTDAIDGMADNAGTSSPALRPRSVLNRIHALVTAGPISRRRRS
ncbi:NAD-dependent epimerase/dehydratase family protein [Allobranchiibius sp. GilTou38]|uniref:NAD-dependent epimerase/dehydratase family protein n=1 Tax=Allobranchiibius sp. GilTou38 TaxID=2815210 RepID=UPI001AA1CB9E|nr:NAD-dependent epimerase/dehydratase family protein [Allobranchiibius sp. GilTou38]MBO1768323.1 NAD-dependent epimerase/dehydratase family protein [Allobranchiibius sp. GilTou38]